MRKIDIATWADLADRQPTHALVGEVDLVLVRRGALMADGRVGGDDLICGLHDWDCRIDTGVSAYANREALQKVSAWVEDGEVRVDADQIAEWARAHPQPFDRQAYLGISADTGHRAAEEPHNALIQRYAREGAQGAGPHGAVEALGVPRDQLPSWDDIQIPPAQLHRMPLLDEHAVGTDVVIGPKARKPLPLAMPLLVSDMNFGALSASAKVALATGAELAGTGICSGEGGMLPEEPAANARYYYELASARFGFGWDKLAGVQAFHFKGGRGAKTGTAGHLPGPKVNAKIAAVGGVEESQAAAAPASRRRCSATTSRCRRSRRWRAHAATSTPPAAATSR